MKISSSLPNISFGSQMVKNLSAMQDTQVWSLGWEYPLEKGMVTHSNILPWRIPRSLAGYSSWGHKELDTTEQLTHTHTHTHAHIIPDTNVKQFKGTKLNKFQTLVIRSSKYMAQINQETSKQQFYHYISGKYSMGIFYEFCQWTHHVRQCSPHWSWINGIFKLIPIIVDNIFEKHNENES